MQVWLHWFMALRFRHMQKAIITQFARQSEKHYTEPVREPTHTLHACNVKDQNIDPELRIYICRFQMWRRLFKSFPRIQSEAFKSLYEMSKKKKQNPGPMSAFIQMTL